MKSNRPPNVTLVSNIKLKLILEIRNIVRSGQIQNQIPGILALIAIKDEALKAELLDLSKANKFSTDDFKDVVKNLQLISTLDTNHNAAITETLNNLQTQFAAQFQLSKALDKLALDIRTGKTESYDALLELVVPEALSTEKINAINMLIGICVNANVDRQEAINLIVKQSKKADQIPLLKIALQNTIDFFGLHLMVTSKKPADVTPTNATESTSAAKPKKPSNAIWKRDAVPQETIKTAIKRAEIPANNAATSSSTKSESKTSSDAAIAAILPPAAESMPAKSNDDDVRTALMDTYGITPVSTLTFPTKYKEPKPSFFLRARTKIVETLCCTAIPSFQMGEVTEYSSVDEIPYQRLPSRDPAEVKGLKRR